MAAEEVHILGIAGSLRRGSFNRGALRAAGLLAPAGARVEIFDLNGIPVYNEDEAREFPARVVELKEKIRAADAVLFATPEYNYSLPGGLKNAIDWASRPYGDSAWDGKPAALMGASVSIFGSARAQYQLRQVLVALNMHAVNTPEVMIGNAAERFDAEGNLTDEMSRELIRQLLHNLVAWARRLKAGG